MVYIKKLYLKNFRNIKEHLFSFSPGINQIIGENGQGKTSILEAIHLCSTGSSFRTRTLQDIIHHGEKGFFIEALFEKEGVQGKVSIFYDGIKKNVLLNDNPVKPIELLGLLQGVVTTPIDSALIKGGPSVRRRFLDIQITQTQPVYTMHLLRYNKALKQRNALLKQKQQKLLFCWEEQLAMAAAYIIQKRQQTVAALEDLANSVFIELSSGMDFTSPMLSFNYGLKQLENRNEKELREFFLEEFKRKQAKELLYGMTLSGPHRDDLDLFLQGKSIRDFSSEGQQKLSILSLRFAELEYMRKEMVDGFPFFVIDDFAACLDMNRTLFLMKRLSTIGQVFLSSHGIIDQKETSIIEVVNGKEK